MSKVQTDRITELRVRLGSLKHEFERDLRARGFDPEQLANSALPTALARTYSEILLLEEQLSGSESKETRRMTELERIADQFKRAFDGEAWHGPSVLNLLSDVNAQQAAAHPIPGVHSIWELVLHIRAWENACLRRVKGEGAQVPDEENFPSITDVGEEEWERAKASMIETHQQLLETIASLDESRLDQPVVDDPNIKYSSVYVTLHGGVQHDLYHAGQIAILKKAVAQS